MVGLVDGNNFYVSCERVFEPALEGRPVAVLSNNDGCCVSRSDEFKALGIPMGTPFFQLRPKAARLGLVLRSSNYELYGDLSRRVIETLRTFVPEIEQYSIDEAFIFPDSPAGRDWNRFGAEIRKTVLQWVGIPCGIGFAPTKTLAKIANHIGKKRPDGVFVMPADPSPILDALPVGEVWGVGRRLVEKLERMGLRTAGALMRADPEALARKFSVTLARTVYELRGRPCIESDDTGEAQSVSCSRSFGTPATRLVDLEESLAEYTATAAEKLRRHGLAAAGANFYVQTFADPAKVAHGGEFRAATVRFPKVTDDTGVMVEAILPAIRPLFREGERYRKTGVVFWGIEAKEGPQPDLFAETEPDRRKNVFRTIDRLNAIFGRNSVFLLAQGIEKPWQMKRGHLSPQYTTKWDDIPVAH